jgi:glycerol uptake facilitator-like aquaporin
MDDKTLRACLAELIGTFAFVFLSAATVCVCYLGELPPTPTNVAVISGLGAGLIYAAALAATVPVSGGYLNPAVTIVLWVFRRLSGGKTIGLIAAQMLGSALAGAALYSLVSMRDDVALAGHLGAPQLTEAVKYSGFSLLKGMGLELLLTAVVAFILFGTALDPRVTRWAGGWVGRLSFLWIGLALAAATMAGSPLTGGGLNPARWFGPWLWDFLQLGGSYRDHAAYWVGPIAGTLLAGWIYTALILPPEEERVAQQTPAPRSVSSAVVGSGLARSKR